MPPAMQTAVCTRVPPLVACASVLCKYKVSSKCLLVALRTQVREPAPHPFFPSLPSPPSVLCVHILLYSYAWPFPRQSKHPSLCVGSDFVFRRRARPAGGATSGQQRRVTREVLSLDGFNGFNDFSRQAPVSIPAWAATRGLVFGRGGARVSTRRDGVPLLLNPGG